jgi:hypothetical protein
MDGYQPYQVRTPEGGGVHDRNGHERAADPTPTNEPAPGPSLIVVVATLIVIYVVAMLFFGLIYYTGTKTASP